MSELIKAGVFEDLSDWHRRIERDITEEGFEVVAEGWDREESIAAISSSESIQAAFIDGNLDLGYQPERDGDVISRMLREKFGKTGLVLVSISDGHPVKGTDMHFPKKEMYANPWGWLEFLKRLRQEF